MANTETVGQRFVALISHLGISKNAFAASLDKTATVIQHLVDERNKPGFDLLCKVFEVYPSVSKGWLLQGIGPMLIEEDSTSAQLSSPPSSPAPHHERVANTLAAATVATSAAAPAIAAAPVAMPAAVPAASPEPVAAPTPAPSNSGAADVPSQVAAEMPTPIASPLSPNASVPSVAPAAPAADTSWQTALYTQQMAHQLALAELRNQHLQEQQRLMQQMMDLMQRQLTR